MAILDDLMSTSAKGSRINDQFTDGSHHRNLAVVVLNQAYFGKDSTQRRNCYYFVPLNNPLSQ